MILLVSAYFLPKWIYLLPIYAKNLDRHVKHICREAFNNHNEYLIIDLILLIVSLVFLLM